MNLYDLAQGLGRELYCRCLYYRRVRELLEGEPAPPVPVYGRSPAMVVFDEMRRSELRRHMTHFVPAHGGSWRDLPYPGGVRRGDGLG